MYKSNLVLEGGALRGIFTSGLLDFFMEQNLEFSDVTGVSAGSFNAIDYLSNQTGRTKTCIMADGKDDNCVSYKDFFTKKQLIDFDKTFLTFSNERYLFDYDNYFKSDMKLKIVATNCLTGRPEYLVPTTNDEIMLYCRASCSMPMFVNMVNIENKPYLDGGISASIPVEYIMEKNFDKNVFILTRQKDFRKPMPRIAAIKILHIMYEKYPELFHTLKTANKRYNMILDYIDKLEEEGKIFVIRPTEKPVSHFEKSSDKLNAFYEHGYDTAKKEYSRLLEYLEK
jgi:predicted patatin/cPLA2 family phospholipase